MSASLNDWDSGSLRMTVDLLSLHVPGYLSSLLLSTDPGGLLQREGSPGLAIGLGPRAALLGALSTLLVSREGGVT